MSDGRIHKLASPNNQLIKLTLEQIERAGLICMAADIPFAIWGPVGIGKTAIVKQIAKKTGLTPEDL